MKITSRIILSEDKLKKGAKAVTLKMVLPVGEAKNNSVLGPLLGQHQINIMSFCNEFNNKSLSKFESGVIVPVFVNLKKDKTYNLNIRYPYLSSFLDQFLIKEGNSRFILIEKLFDIVNIFSFFLKQELKSVTSLVFGYLSSYNIKVKIK